MTDTLHKFRAEVGNIPKNGVDPVMQKHDIDVIQNLSSVDGKPALETTLTVGDKVVSTGLLPLPGDTPQALAASVTYMRRYSLVTVLGLVCDEDSDGNDAQPRPAQVQQQVTEAFPGATEQANPDAPSDKQWGYLAKLTNQTVDACKAQYGQLTKKQMSTTIDGLKPSPKPEVPPGHEPF